MTLFGSTTLFVKVVWLVIAVVFGIIEAFTVSLTTIWFSIGAIAAMVTSTFTDSILIQVLVFGIVSTALLVLATKGLIKRDREVKSTQTNIDAIIGKTGYVKKDIKEGGVGIITIGNEDWSAVDVQGKELAEGTKVMVISIEGVKVVVREVKSL